MTIRRETEQQTGIITIRRRCRAPLARVPWSRGPPGAAAHEPRGSERPLVSNLFTTKGDNQGSGLGLGSVYGISDGTRQGRSIFKANGPWARHGLRPLATRAWDKPPQASTTNHAQAQRSLSLLSSGRSDWLREVPSASTSAKPIMMSPWRQRPAKGV